MAATDSRVVLEPGWSAAIGDEFEKSYMGALREFLRAEKAAGKAIYPHSSCWFNAFSRTPFDKVRVVILGQDPYHGPGQAHGLCFSVPPGVAIPPSLINIYKEIEQDLGLTMPRHGCLTGWAEQGVLLLNSVLTVGRAQAASHRGKGWEQFTDQAIAKLSSERDGVVFMLWGAYAQRKGEVIDASRHLVLKAPHPSPLSAHRGFLGCGHFSATNDYFSARHEPLLNWAALPADEA